MIDIDRLAALQWCGPLAAAHPLVHLNVCLNVIATVLLVVGWRQIKRGAEHNHGRTMIATLVVSSTFLVSYLTYHYIIGGRVEFTHSGAVRCVYLAILISHTILAAAAPFLILPAAYYGMRSLGWFCAEFPSADEIGRFRDRHRRIVKWAFPIWLYVSITGVVVYLMLYVLWPSAAT